MGQKIGAKGLRTRRKLIDVTVELLETHGIRDLTVAEVARVAQTSTATFYVYFDSVQSVVLAALAEAPHTTPEMLALFDRRWRRDEGLAQARAFVRLYTELWDRHRTILRVRNMAADEGDPRFLQARLEGARPLINALARQVREGQAEGVIPAAIGPDAHAGALLTMMERISSIGPAPKWSQRVDYNGLRESAAYIVAQTLGAA